MKTLLRAALVSASAAAIIAPARADQAAEAFVAGVLTEANAIFENSDAASRDASVETLVDKYVDMERVARFALGQYARQATPEQMAVYTPLFRRYATSVYQSTLENYSGQKLQVTDSIDRTERDFIVNSKVVGAKPGDQYADLVVSWRVYRKPDGAQAIVDAGAEGVWLAIEQQSQFKSVIANNGGGAKGIDALIADLKTKVGG
ncbi:MAG TPA: toluene tolerance protein [Parvularcula sp.]|nr:toluene tolerance protein [Parvularcula sp.]HBS36218.1 toluene tolerance protein [Parvularcula sp.]